MYLSTQEAQIVFQLALLHGTTQATDHQSACQAVTTLFTKIQTSEFASDQTGTGLSPG